MAIPVNRQRQLGDEPQANNVPQAVVPVLRLPPPIVRRPLSVDQHGNIVRVAAVPGDAPQVDAVAQRVLEENR